MPISANHKLWQEEKPGRFVVFWPSGFLPSDRLSYSRQFRLDKAPIAGSESCVVLSVRMLLKQNLR